jgi:hypothetical protein
MAKPKIDSVKRLAGLILAIEDKRGPLDEIRQLVEQLQRGGIMTVSGEAVIVKRLADRHTVAMELLRSFGETSNNGIEDALGQLEEVLNAVEWSAAGTIRDELKRKAQSQADILRPYLDRLAKWRALIDGVQQLLGEGLKAHAPVFTEQRDVQRYEASISIAERALREQQYLLLIQSLNQLPEGFEVVETIRARLQEKIKRTEQFSRQADLLFFNLHWIPNCGAFTTPCSCGPRASRARTESTSRTRARWLSRT